MAGRGARARQQHGLAIATDGPFQDSRELGVAQRDVRFLGCQGGHNIPEHEQAAVDLRRLFELCAFNTTLLYPLGAGKVDDIEAGALGDEASRHTRFSYAFRQPDMEDGMAPARVLVHEGLGIHDIRVRPRKQVQHLLRSPANNPCQAGNDSVVLHIEVLPAASMMLQVQKVINLLVVHLHSGGLHLVLCRGVPPDVIVQANDQPGQQAGVFDARACVEQGIGLAAPSLAISEDCAVDATQKRLQYRRANALEHLRLSSMLCKNAVEVEVPALDFAVQSHSAAFHVLDRTRSLPTWAKPDEDHDSAIHIRHRQDVG
mmetsp:Transcript_119661/g.345892  ORF Transcript_119661/g.345892 Transcript_119661/m.345892 type:complete len:316 (-) Transcript_119661:612-1559(-)